VLALPPVRAALNLSWFRITLLTLTGVCLFNLFLFQVETHRQRSERLEVQGVYFGANQGVYGSASAGQAWMLGWRGHSTTSTGGRWSSGRREETAS
jgi:hypothetical protein